MEVSKVRESEVNKMMNDVSNVINSHLNNLVKTFEEDTKNMISTVEILKKLPIIKDLERRLEKVCEENLKLKAEIEILKKMEEKHIILQTEEINANTSPASYCEIDALVTTQIQNKDLENTQGSGDIYMDYIANQSDTDTSEDDSDNETDIDGCLIDGEAYRLIRSEDIDEIMQEELKSDLYMLGCCTD